MFNGLLYNISKKHNSKMSSPQTKTSKKVGQSRLRSNKIPGLPAYSVHGVNAFTVLHNRTLLSLKCGQGCNNFNDSCIGNEHMETFQIMSTFTFSYMK